MQDVTGIDKSAMERLLVLADYSITLNGVFNTGANASHAVLKTVSSTSTLRQVTLVHSSQTLAVETYIPDYALTRSPTGELTWTATPLNGNGAVPTWS